MQFQPAMQLPSASFLSPPLFGGLAGHEELQEPPRDPAHADICNQARRNPIQADQCLLHERSEKERMSEARGCSAPETVISDNRAAAAHNRAHP